LIEKDLPRYYADLSAQLSERQREFERQALSAILYNKKQDQLRSISLSLPTEIEKEQLVGAFKDAGLLTKKMQDRINDHFDEAKEVIRKFSSKNPNDLKPEDFLMLPLISRTQIMVKYAKELEEDRKRIFASLRLYEEIVNSFLDDKFIEVDDSGQLKIESSSSDLNPRLLSSGEKQILILLTEALLRVDKPVVYIADEPELSLHVTWQEKLLESLEKLSEEKPNEQMQVIVATHSPDIVGNFQDKVIDLGKES
jgi:predicted ATPase